MIEELSLLDPASLKPPLDTRLVTDDSGLADMVEYLSGIDIIGYDIETNMADDFTTRKVRTVQLGDRNRQYVIDLLAFAGSEEAMLQQGNRTAPVWAQSLTNAIGRFVEDGRYHKVGQNLGFEHETMLWNLGIRGWNYHDTMLCEKVLHCGDWPLFGKDIWGLKDIVARYYKKALSKKEQKGFDLRIPLRLEQVQYAGLDIRIPLSIRELQLKHADKQGLRRAMAIQNEALPAFGDMKVNGMLLDWSEWMVIVESTEEQHRKNVAELDTFFIPVYGTKDNPVSEISAEKLYDIEMRWRNEEDDRERRKQLRGEYQAAAKKYKERVKDRDKWEGEAAINYGSDESILDGLRMLGYSVVATNEKALSKIKDTPVVKALFAYRGTSTILSRYGRSFSNYVNPITGRIHPNINLFGAETGRTSAVKPNSQNIPKPNRKCFKARPGYVLLTSDMSGAELRIIAELSGDKTWLQAFKDRWDVHSIGAEMMFGAKWHEATEADCAFAANHKKCKCTGHEEMRDWVKAINFGVAYGMEEYTLAQRLDIPTEEARSLLRLWRQVNSVIAEYLKDSGNDAKTKSCARTFSGFRRKFKLPTWDKAKQIAIARRLENGKDVNVTGFEISKVFNGMLASIEREGKNTPIQGGNADVAKVAMGAGFDREGKPFMFHILPQYKAELINFVHDEFVIEVPAEYAEECKEAVMSCIRRAGAEFMTEVVMEAEANISVRWEK